MKIKKQTPSVTIAISAYNEEENIKSFLESVLMQKEEGYQLKGIWVYSDGSTDKTVKIVRSFSTKKITLIPFSKRIGKSSRLNIIYKKLKTDILIQSDADVIFTHPYIVRDIIQPLVKNQKVGMCGGNPTPVAGESFTEQAVNCTFTIYQRFRSFVRGGNNVFSADGRLLAFSKSLVKKIHIPEDMIANDMYAYFCCLSLGYEYRFVKTAVVYFRSPNSLQDHIRQNIRFEAAPIRMKRYFSKQLIESEINIPGTIFISSALLEFMKHPLLCSFILFINLYCRIIASLMEAKMTAIWTIAYSTKRYSNRRLFSYETKKNS